MIHLYKINKIGGLKSSIDKQEGKMSFTHVVAKC